jgi:hypothetical protein
MRTWALTLWGILFSVFIAVIKLLEVKRFLVRALRYSPNPSTSVNAGDLQGLKKRWCGFLRNDSKGLPGHVQRTRERDMRILSTVFSSINTCDFNQNGMIIQVLREHLTLFSSGTSGTVACHEQQYLSDLFQCSGIIG